MTLTNPQRRDGEPVFIPIVDALQEEADMLDRVVSGQSQYEFLLWQTSTCLVAPRSLTGNDNFKRACRLSRESGWPIHLRGTGGDVTPQGKGVINISIAYGSPDGSGPSIKAAYERLCRPILQALEEAGIKGDYGHVDNAFCDGAYNITIGGKKFSGTAQRWKKVKWERERFAIFSHALLLIEPPSARTIDAINSFYIQCGIDREIKKNAHAGLSEQFLCWEQRDCASFLSSLRARYASDGDV